MAFVFCQSSIYLHRFLNNTIEIMIPINEPD